MKKLFTAALALLSFATSAQQKFTIEGKISNPKGATKVYFAFRNSENDVVRDSATLNNGTFSFKGESTEIIDASLILAHNGETLKQIKKADIVFVILENGLIRLKATDSLIHADVSGTPLNVDYDKLAKAKAPAAEKIRELRTNYALAKAEGKEDEFNKQHQDDLQAASDAFEKVDFDYIKSHPNSYMSLMILQVYVSSKPIATVIEPDFKSFAPSIKDSRVGKLLAAAIEKYKNIDVNAVAPDFTQADTAGKAVSLSSFKGKYVLLDFWASWCKPCRAENPNVLNAYNNYKDKNFVVLGVSLDYPGAKAQWLKAIADDHLNNFTEVSDLKGGGNEAASLYNVSAIPQNFLIGPDGKIIAKNLTGTDLQEKLASILNK